MVSDVKINPPSLRHNVGASARFPHRRSEEKDSTGVSPRSFKKGVTLIELIVAMLSISIIALAAGTVLIYLWQEFLYLPRQLKARQVGQAVLDEMTEGTTAVSGLRFAKSITGATVSQVNYTYGYPATEDEHTVVLRFDSTNKKIYRSFDSGPEEAVPYYSVGTNIGGKTVSTTVFTYYKADGSAWVLGVDALSAIKRVQADINITTGTGAFASYEGNVNISSGVEIKQY
jgi:prepilin-type N-terminal cleavage/methylation domain-containing protein